MPTSVTNVSPAMAITQALVTYATFPSYGFGSYNPDTLGAIRHFAFDFAPTGTISANGQLFSTAANPELYAVIGDVFGGDGESTFALPDLQHWLTVGVGSGSGLALHLRGELFGSEFTGLLTSNLPAQYGGVAAPFDNNAPSLPLIYVINFDGSGSTGIDMPGAVWQFAGAGVPGGTVECNGQSLEIADYPDLYAVIGTTYGGDGITYFNVPDLQGRTVVGATTDIPGYALGTMGGTEEVVLTIAQLPSAISGSEQPFNNQQPYVALNYLIATSGIIPSETPSTGSDGTAGMSSGSTGGDRYLGEIIAYAGTTPPAGWVIASGQMLAISSNQALFDLIGTTYGGDGVNTFALPDLRGLSIYGAETPSEVGTVVGEAYTTLELDHIPSVYRTGTDASEVFYGANDGDRLLGNGGNDTLVGREGNDVLEGGEGADFLQGGAGTDTMTGGTGDDKYYVNDATDVVVEAAGGGEDRVLVDVSYALAAGVHVEVLGVRNPSRTTPIDLTGNEFGQLLSGNLGNNVLNGGGGDDSFAGGGGTDTFIGGTGNDVFRVDDASDIIFEYAGEGSDLVRVSSDYTLAEGVSVETMTTKNPNSTAAFDLTGNSFANLIYGNAGANTLSGGGGIDRLRGQGGNDTLIGGAGADELTGGAGNDVFAFGDVSDSSLASPDRILDFASGDLIDLSAIDANSGLGGNQAFTFVGSAAFSNTAGELRFTQSGGETFVYGDTNGDGVADFAIRISGTHALTVDYFTL